jgi:hypothetical protein
MAGSAVHNFLNDAFLRSDIASSLDAVISAGGQFGSVPPGPGPGTVTVNEGPGFVAFSLNGELRWIVDVRLFAGSPSLTVQPVLPGGTRIELKDARFPGTQLPADFVAEVGPRGAFGTPMRLSFTLGGFGAEVILERWLVGLDAARSAITVDSEVCPLGAASRVWLAGNAEAWFTPNWLFQLIGTQLATVSGLGPGLISDRLWVKLLFPANPSLAGQPKSRRTLLSMTADPAEWMLKPSVLDLPIGRLAASDGLFDRLDIEAGESPAGVTARILAASSVRDDALAIQFAGAITGPDGQPGSLALVRPLYVVAFGVSSGDQTGDQTRLAARFGDQPQWLITGGVAVQVNDDPATTGFEADTFAGEVTSVRCVPALLCAAGPPATSGAAVDGMVATLAHPAAAGAVLPFVDTPGTAPGWGILAGAAVAGQPQVSLPDFRVSVLRREDLLWLEFACYNLCLETGDGLAPRLVRQDTTQPSYVVAVFDSPQNLAEQAFTETYSDPKNHSTADPLPSPPAPVDVLAAGPSRLAFAVPPGTDSLAYSLASLLDWPSLVQSVAPVALPDPPGHVSPAPQIREPLATETAIEAPWRLMLSPDEAASWSHSGVPVTRDGRTELWHTRLAVRVPGENGHVADETLPRIVRAIWSPDYSAGPLPPHPLPTDTFPTRQVSLDANDRDQIVRLSSDFRIRGYQPAPVKVSKLFLTALGGWLDLLADFNPPVVHGLHFSLLQWRHLAAMARDSYVRVETAGYLCHGGHRATLVKITERKFQPDAEGRTTAYLRQRFYILVREPEKDYTTGFLTDTQQRGFPYQSLRITTLVTPDLDTPQVIGGAYSFFPQVGGEDFLFHMVGTDSEGQTSEFVSPLYFVEEGGNYSTAVNEWNGSGQTARDLGGQKIAYAARDKPGDTTLDTSSLTINAVLLDNGAADPPFFPKMAGAAVNVPAIQQVTGKPGAVTVGFYPNYLTGGFGTGGVFLQLDSVLPVGFSGDQSGGVATPNLQVSGLSRRFGTVSGPINDIAGGTFDPKQFFAGAGATLFGVVSLQDLIEGAFGDNTVPALLTQRQSGTIRTSLHWAPTVKSGDYGPITLSFTDPASALTIDALIVTHLDGSPREASVTGALNGFTLSLANVIELPFASLTFDAPAGRKLDVAANLAGGLEFIGDLSFLNTLRQLIPTDGFSDPPSVDVTTQGVEVGYSLPVPSIGVGVFSLENIRLAAGLTLPFLPPSPLRFRFAFSERDHPFLISVAFLGGGGFFGIALGPDGVEMLEASLEVGANVSIDLVVASGNVHIMAGVYLRLDNGSPPGSQLTGYLRAGGSLDILGLISASVEFYLGFTYYFGPPCSIAGEATVTIEVHVLFFSAAVHPTLRREFADPQISVADLLSPADWDYYCDSFAG